jgi:hypothetical protein
MKYVGLTEDPVKRKEEHGNPPDWWQKSFLAEKEARDWKSTLARTLNEPGVSMVCSIIVLVLSRFDQLIFHHLMAYTAWRETFLST